MNRPPMRPPGNMRFTNWNYGTTMVGQGRGGGYVEQRMPGPGNFHQGNQNYGQRPPQGGFQPRGDGGFQPRGEGGFRPRGDGGFRPRGEGGYQHRGGFNPRFRGRGGPRGPGGVPGRFPGSQRAPLPDQDALLPASVKDAIEKYKWKTDKVPGVIVKDADGKLKKLEAPDPDADVDLNQAPEPTRFDKSVQGILNGRNAAMFVGVECRKRQWEIEFECLEADGPVHNRVYSYSLTVGPPGSDDVLVTAGIARGKREAKRRACEAMVLKLDDLPPAPPLPMPPGMMRGMRPGFRPRLPPPESEETIFRNYDKTAYGDDHPNKNHPVFQLCSKAKKSNWPPPTFELVTEKIVDTIRNKHGKSNTMLYTYKVTVWPGVGQVDPKIFFGSGPTKKDAKFAAGTIAWAAIMNPKAVAKKTAEGEAEAAEGSGAASSSALPGETPAQMAVRLAATATAPKLKSAQHVTEEKWLQQVAAAAEKAVDLKSEVEKLKAEKKVKLEEEEARRIEEREKRHAERAKRGGRSRSRTRRSRSRTKRSRSKTSRRSRSRTRRSRSRTRRSRSRTRRDRSRSIKRERSVKKEKDDDDNIGGMRSRWDD